MRAFFIVLLTAGLLLPIPGYGQKPAPVDEFLAAAKARNHEKMLGFMTATVKMVSGNEVSSKEFVEFIAQCEPMKPGGGIMGWLCPAGVGGRTACWSLAGGWRLEGEKVALEGWGDPGFPVKCSPKNP